MSWIRQRLKTLSRIRYGRSLESSFFITTFVAALLTVSISASSILPCPANGHHSISDQFNQGPRNAFSEEQEMTDRSAGIDRDALPVGGLGQRAHLTRKGGWIEIEQRPSVFSLRRWTG